MDNTRELALDVFVKIVNLCEPEHKYEEEKEIYPIDRDEVDYSYCWSSSSTLARCGPRSGPHKKAGYSIDKTAYKKASPGKVLAITTHEITHLKGRNFYTSVHPKEFWQEMTFYVWTVRENLEEFEENFGKTITEKKFLEEVLRDINYSTIDRRIHSVEECRTMVAELLGVKDLLYETYPKYK